MNAKNYPIFSFANGRTATATGSAMMSTNIQMIIDQGNTVTRSFHKEIRESVKEVCARGIS